MRVHLPLFVIPVSVSPVFSTNQPTNRFRPSPSPTYRREQPTISGRVKAIGSPSISFEWARDFRSRVNVSTFPLFPLSFARVSPNCFHFPPLWRQEGLVYDVYVYIYMCKHIQNTRKTSRFASSNYEELRIIIRSISLGTRCISFRV